MQTLSFRRLALAGGAPRDRAPLALERSRDEAAVQSEVYHFRIAHESMCYVSPQLAHRFWCVIECKTARTQPLDRIKSDLGSTNRVFERTRTRVRHHTLNALLH